MRWVYAQRAPALAKAVLVNLAWHANDQGIAWPSQTTMAKECDMSVSAVKRHLHTLEGLGLIGREVRVREHRVNDANRYQLATPTRSLLNGYPSNPDVETRSAADPYPFTGDARPVQQRTGTRSPVNPEVPGELPREVPEGLSAESTRPGRQPGEAIPKPKPKHPPADDAFIAELVAEFSERLGGAAAVREHVDEALNHTARRKALDERVYLRGWLRRDAERRAERLALLSKPAAPARNGTGHPGTSQAAAARAWGEQMRAGTA